MTDTKPIIIAGGGIGGLSLAMGLSQKGFRSIVLEKAIQLGEIGAGIQLGPNAFHAFDYLGVGNAARAMAVYIDELRLMDAMTGKKITNIPLGEDFRNRFKNPYAVVHRGELHGVFLKACSESDLIELHTNAEVSNYEQNGSEVTVSTHNGQTFIGSALIGADGLWSNVRKQLVNDGMPRVTGHSTYRSVIPVDKMPEDLRWNAATLWAGPKCHIVHYPLSDWKLFNLVVTYHNDAPEPVAGQQVEKADVLRGFEHIHEVPRQLIELSDDWRLWVLCDRDPISNWVDGRVALLGDAAHPTMQYYAQGACMAMEDAVCLAAEMEANEGNIEKSLVSYQAKRTNRTARIQLQSRAIGDHIYHPSGAHAELRNTMMSTMTDNDWYDRFQWLYGGTGLEGGSEAVY